MCSSPLASVALSPEWGRGRGGKQRADERLEPRHPEGVRFKTGRDDGYQQGRRKKIPPARPGTFDPLRAGRLLAGDCVGIGQLQLLGVPPVDGRCQRLGRNLRFRECGLDRHQQFRRPQFLGRGFGRRLRLYWPGRRQLERPPAGTHWRGGHREGRQLEFKAGGSAFDSLIRFPEKESAAHGAKRMRLEHQRYLPGFGEVALVNGDIRIREKDLAARVGVVPSHWPDSRRMLRRHQFRQAGMVAVGERKRGAQGALALKRRVVQHTQPVILPFP